MGRLDLVYCEIGNEPELFSLFNAKDKITILDIGSCDALHAIRYSTLFLNATIHAFEPRPDNVEKIKAHLHEFNVTDRVIVHETALSDRTGLFDFYISYGEPPGIDDDYVYGNKSSSLLKPKLHLEETPWCKFNNSSVQTYRYDEIENSPVKVDYIHMDVQGAELKVLDGFGEELKKVRGVWMEVSRIPFYANQPLYDDVHAYMTGKGFILVKDAVGEKAGDQFWVNTDTST